METIQQPRQVEAPSPLRRPPFPKSPLSDDKFVDPFAEARRRMLVPEQTIQSPVISLEIAQATKERGAEKAESFFSSIYEYFMVLFSQLKRKVGRNRRARARLTRTGSQALEQLRYLAQLCDAAGHRTPEEVLAAEAAFGEAYYEIMTLSQNLERMTEKEGEHHLRSYARHVSRVLQAAD